MATPSLAMIPSAIADSKVYSVLPNNGDGDFTFDRASTATRVGQNGLIETVAIDLPRLNYDISNGVVQSCPSLLLEPASTNLITYSEDFSQWTDAGTTTVLSNITNPSGGLQSYLLSASSSATNALRYDDSFSVSANYSYSLFLKAGTSQEVRMQIYDGSSFFRFAVNPLNNFAVVDQSGVNSYLIEDFTNGWKRVSINITTSASASTGYLQIYPDRTGNLNNVYIFGAQLEALSYATSYIPNSGQSAGVTRAAETCDDAGTSSTFNSEEGSLFVEMKALVDDATFRVISLSDGTLINRMIVFYSTSTNVIRYLYAVSGQPTSADLSFTSSDITNNTKIAVTWKLNEFKFYVDGVKVGEDLSGAVNSPGVLSILNMADGDEGNPLYGKCKDLRVYNEALTDAQLTVLTTL